MKKYEVESSNIKEVSYDPDAKLLIVVFHNGSSYSYSDVEPDSVCSLLFSESIGKAFHDSIKKHKCTKL